MLFPCPYLAAPVELTDERHQHILDRHPDLLPDYLDRLAEVLAVPDEIRRDNRFPNTRLFSRSYPGPSGEKAVVVAVVSDAAPSQRHWIVTAYLARVVRQGETEWKRN